MKNIYDSINQIYLTFSLCIIIVLFTIKYNSFSIKIEIVREK